MRDFRLCVLFVLLGLPATCEAESTEFRVASYNIKFLDDNEDPDRYEALKRIIDGLDAHVIALQEIDDRDALQEIFDDDEWQIVIDDDSTEENQDVAAVVRAPLMVVKDLDGDGEFEEVGDLDADDEDFLFPDNDDNGAFPRRRDVLHVQIRVPDIDQVVHLFVVHAKARPSSRPDTNFRRVQHARDLLQMLDAEFEDVPFILIGDFNDNQDDEGPNILESGDPNAAAAMENEPGLFLNNLTEPLLLDDLISWTTNSQELEVIDGRLIPRVEGSRNHNFVNRFDEVGAFEGLIDQILIPAWMSGHHTGVVGVFNDVDPDDLRMGSDHFPVYADFRISVDENLSQPVAHGVQIRALLPDPVGRDPGNELIVLGNRDEVSVNLEGWKLVDRGEHELELTGEISAGGTLEIRAPAGEFPLTNSGDEVSLFDESGHLVDRVSYTEGQVIGNELIQFGQE